MNHIVARSLFHTAVVQRSWKTQATSITIHVLVIAAAFLITFPVVKDLSNPAPEHVTLIAPFIPRPHITIQPPLVKQPVKVPTLVIPPPIVAKVAPPVIPAPVPKPVVQPSAPRVEAELKPAPPVPKPAVNLPTLDTPQVAKAAPVPKQVIVGGFGDPRGIQPTETPKPQPVLVARAGGFDNPAGSGQTGGGAHANTGVLKQSGFGNAAPSSTSTSTVGTVRTGNFGDTSNGASRSSGAVRSTGFGDTVASVPQPKMALASASAFTPVEILFKPRPSYSMEARDLHLEGQVSLEVVFQASGAVKVIRIIKGLGHGLDEAAQQAALQVRFKPAMRSGAPVDTNATISITFQLT